MTEELKQLREALRRVKYEAASLADAQVIALEALTQRPAAQTDDHSEQLTKAKRLLVDLHKIGGEDVRIMIEARTGPWFVWGQARASLPTQPAAQAGEREAKCQTCNGHGLVGGHLQDGSGYCEGCPDCNPDPAPLVKWASAQPAAQADSMGMPTSCGKPLCAPDEHHPLCDLHKPAAQATPEPLTGCNCRWQGETQVEWCELHLAHKDAIHEWAERAKAAEAKLKAAPDPVGEPAGEAGAMPGTQGFTMACFHADKVPVGAKLYTRPAPGVPEGSALFMRALLQWAVGRWQAEVQDRPMVNKNRRTLDDTWRQVIRFAGGNPDALVGPSHDDMLAAAQAKGER